MHGLPDGAALGVVLCQNFQNFRGAGLPCLCAVKGFAVRAHLGAHGVLVDDQGGEPVVGNGARHDGVHRHGQIPQPLAIALIDRLFLGDVLLQMGVLAPDDPGDNVAHAVVVAHFLMLIPGGVLARLRRPLPCAVGILKGVGQETPAGRAGDDLVAVIGDGGVVAEAAALLAVHRGAHGLGGVLDEQRAVLFADALDLVHLGGEAVQMRHDHQLHLRIQGERLFQRDRIHVPAVGLGVDKDGDAALVDHGVQRGVKGHV